MFTISMNRVHDTVRIREGAETLTLKVDADAMRMVAGMNQARKALSELNAESEPTDFNNAALFFAAVIFGDDQAHQLMDFYRGDGACVINVCGSYFQSRLSKLIDKAQRRTAR